MPPAHLTWRHAETWQRWQALVSDQRETGSAPKEIPRIDNFTEVALWYPTGYTDAA